MVVRRPVIFLDEPTTGLDPDEPRGGVGAIEGLVRDGAALLLTTQYLEEADRLADAIVVLSGGRTVAEGTPAQLKARVGERRVHLTIPADGALATAARVFERLDPELDLRARRLSIPAPGGPARPHGRARRARRRGRRGRRGRAQPAHPRRRVLRTRRHDGDMTRAARSHIAGETRLAARFPAWSALTEVRLLAGRSPAPHPADPREGVRRGAAAARLRPAVRLRLRRRPSRSRAAATTTPTWCPGSSPRR